MLTTKYVKLKVKGITEKDWNKAYKEIFG